MWPQLLLKALHSCSDPAVGIHHSRLGNSLLHIPQREYHQHMTRAPLTLGHLACCLPLQPLHTENACVYVHKCHGQQPLTRNTALRQKEITERKRVGEARFGKKRKTKRVMGGHQNMLVSSGYATNVMKWLMVGFFVLKGIPLFTLSSFSTSPSPQYSGLISVLFFSKKHWCYTTFRSPQV